MSLIGKKLLSLNNQSQKRPAVQDAHKSFEQAQSIGILFSWEDKKKEDFVSNFIHEIGEGKSVSCLCFNPIKREVIDSSFPVFSLNNLTMLGKIDSEETNRFLQEPFDYLFHLDFELHEITRSLLTRCKARYRVGFHTDEGEKFYELMIGINKNAGLDNFAGQMLKYVNALK